MRTNKTAINYCLSWLFIPLIFISLQTFADKTKLQSVQLEDLSWMDKNKMQQQIDKVNDLAISKLGLSLHNNWDDIDLLQKLIDKNFVSNTDTAFQEAMGVALGNVMQADFPNHLQWKVYIDKLGRSKSLCIKGTQDCLFPITILSRRMKLGVQPKVAEVYDHAIYQIDKNLPKMPYGDDLLHQLKR